MQLLLNSLSRSKRMASPASEPPAAALPRPWIRPPSSLVMSFLRPLPLSWIEMPAASVSSPESMMPVLRLKISTLLAWSLTKITPLVVSALGLLTVIVPLLSRSIVSASISRARLPPVMVEPSALLMLIKAPVPPLLASRSSLMPIVPPEMVPLLLITGSEMLIVPSSEGVGCTSIAIKSDVTDEPESAFWPTLTVMIGSSMCQVGCWLLCFDQQWLFELRHSSSKSLLRWRRGINKNFYSSFDIHLTLMWVRLICYICTLCIYLVFSVRSKVQRFYKKLIFFALMLRYVFCGSKRAGFVYCSR